MQNTNETNRTRLQKWPRLQKCSLFKCTNYQEWFTVSVIHIKVPIRVSTRVDQKIHVTKTPNSQAVLNRKNKMRSIALSDF